MNARGGITPGAGVLICVLALLAAAVLLPAWGSARVPRSFAQTSEASAWPDAPHAAAVVGDSVRQAPPNPPSPSVSFDGTPSFSTVDNDGDGLVNLLLLHVPLHLDAVGLYWFITQATSTGPPLVTNHYFELPAGNVTVLLPMSGLVVRQKSGDLTVTLQIAEVSEGGWQYLLEWRGTYSIPDPAIFEDTVPVNAVVRVVGPLEPTRPAILRFWNTSNAFEAIVELPVGLSYEVALPPLEFTVLAQATDDTWTWENVSALRIEEGVNATFLTGPAGPVLDETTFSIVGWTLGTGWMNRSFPDRPSARYFADLTGDGDGVLTEREIRVYTSWRVPEASAAPDIAIEGVSLTLGALGAPRGFGAGPVVSPADMGVSRQASFQVDAAASSEYGVRLNLANPAPGFGTAVTFHWPADWILGSADSAWVTSPLGYGTTRVEVGRQSFVTEYIVNLGVIRESDGEGSMSGIVRENATRSTDPGRPIRGATVRLLRADAPVAVNITDADGRFRFDAVSGGPYVLEASAPGYVIRRASVHVVAFQATSLEDVLLDPVPPEDLSALLLGGGLAVVAATVAVAMLARWRRRNRRNRGMPPTEPPS